MQLNPRRNSFFCFTASHHFSVAEMEETVLDPKIQAEIVCSTMAIIY